MTRPKRVLWVVEWQKVLTGEWIPAEIFSLRRSARNFASTIGFPHRVRAYVPRRLDLEKVLRAMLEQDYPVYTGNPTDAERIKHWVRERSLGNGGAQVVLDAYAALGAYVPREER